MVTIADVAREARVSISTVSYALTGKRSISEETKKRVIETAQRLGYTARASARALAANRSEIVAVTAPFHPATDASAHMAFAMEITIQARAHDYDTLLLVHDDALAGMKRSAASALADGIIVLDVSANDERAHVARSLTCPVVFIGVPDAADGLVCVDLDFELAIRLAVDALVEHGHRAIALISQPKAIMQREPNFPLRMEREFARYGAQRGLHVVIVHPDQDHADTAVAELFARQPSTTALVLSTTTGVVDSLDATLAGHGLSIPSEISVITAGMMTPSYASQQFDAFPLEPQLTCPVAVKQLVELMAGQGPPPGVTLVAPTYRPRGTVAAAPITASTP